MIVLSNLSYDFGLIILIIIFRPQKLPSNFSITFDINEENEIKPINIYLVKININIEKNLLIDFSNENMKTLDIPFAILNPYIGILGNNLIKIYFLRKGIIRKNNDWK